MSVGCHDLLRRPQEPALLVTSVEEVLEGIGAFAEAGAGAAAGVGSLSTHKSVEALDATSRRVLEAFPARGAVTEDRLCYLAALPITHVLRSLPILHDAALIVPTQGGWSLCRRGGQP
jgi:DNA processing protein